MEASPSLSWLLYGIIPWEFCQCSRINVVEWERLSEWVTSSSYYLLEYTACKRLPVNKPSKTELIWRTRVTYLAGIVLTDASLALLLTNTAAMWAPVSGTVRQQGPIAHCNREQFWSRASVWHKCENSQHIFDGTKEHFRRSNVVQLSDSVINFKVIRSYERMPQVVEWSA